MIVIASWNTHKVSEIIALPVRLDHEVKSIADFADCPVVEEDGCTFEENSTIKAVKYSLWLRRFHGIWPPIIAEDSGLEIESLMSWPGVLSARIAPTAEERIDLVLKKLGVSANRAARFVGVTALAINGHLIRTWQGIAPGVITRFARGKDGFGYDPIFEEPVSGMTFAEMSAAEKNRVSHRSKAWLRTFEYITKKYDSLM